MKRCPECGREYDNTMMFCLDDGAELLYGPASVLEPPSAVGQFAEEPATAILHETAAPGEAPTRAQIHTTGQTAVLPSGITEVRKPKSFDKRLILAPLALAAIILGGFFGYRYFAGSNSKQIESIAVMPFVNASGNSDLDYLSDGMTETLITSLAHLPALNVKPRSLVFRYKGKDVAPQTLGNELGVQAILNGNVVQRGDALLLFVELVDVASTKVIWSQQYNSRAVDAVNLQAEVARDASKHLKARVSADDEAKVTRAYQTNPDAYELYLKGRHAASQQNEGSFEVAIDYYNRSIEKDPTYPLAYGGIVRAYTFASGWYLAPNDAMPKAKAAALKTLQLDEENADIHAELAGIAFWYDYDWVTGEREMKRASELDPEYSILPLYFSAMGRHDEAIRAQELSTRQSPLDVGRSSSLEAVYFLAGRYDQAIEQAKKTLEINPNYWGSYSNAAAAYERKHMYAEAVASLEKARSLDRNPHILGYLGYVYATAGRSEEAQKILVELRERSKQGYVSPYMFAIVYSGLNDKDQAFEWLERAFQDRSYYMTLLRVDTVFDNLRTDPRFSNLIRRINLPPLDK